MKKDTTYKKVASHEASLEECKTVLLLYSGGLDTSVMLKWIQDEYDCEIVTLTVDIGQLDDLNAVKEKALKLGAKKALVVDAKKDFAEQYISQGIKANADYQGGYHLFCPLGRAVISSVAVEVAEQEGIHVIAHGATGKGNDQVRFESYITTLNPKLKTIAPVREWSMGRDEQLAYAQKHDIPVKQSAKKIYSYDENLWGSSAEGGEIEDLTKVPNLENILQLCVIPEKAPDEVEYVEITFEQGLPVAINGEDMKLQACIEKLSTVGAKHGVGITHLIEDRVVGLKVRGVYEEPAAAILVEAHSRLEKMVCTREENEMKTAIDQKWAYLTYGAKWFHPLMPHLNAYIESVNMKVSGNVTVKLYKGTVSVVASDSPYSLFDDTLSTFMANSSFNQNASAGFIELWNLPQKTSYSIHKTLYKK